MENATRTARHPSVNSPASDVSARARHGDCTARSIVYSRKDWGRWPRQNQCKLLNSSKRYGERVTHKESDFYKGWNAWVLFFVVAVPLGLVFIEYIVRKDVCGPKPNCHPLDFFAPTMTAAAIALVLPGMSLPREIGKLHDVATAEARRTHRWTRFFWASKVALAILSVAFALATFFVWGLVLGPEESASIQDKWTQLQTIASIFYAVGAVLTLFKTGLEWYGND